MMNHRFTYEKIWRDFGKRTATAIFQKECCTFTYTDPVDIAEHFKQVFTSSNFNSYADNQSVTELKVKLSKMDKWESSKKIFHVIDIEKVTFMY